eukprot:TRINITY_DN7441_c0_g1_i3.p1 TRINITY_DN7441_c0_g1~~TRINITY_DN7441_c0_g1_i3.p1  ORF type:complete len:301 (+),score=90.61 TRINITY_DN7441_c0_g1_i3:180-1082(+)
MCIRDREDSNQEVRPESLHVSGEAATLVAAAEAGASPSSTGQAVTLVAAAEAEVADAWRDGSDENWKLGLSSWLEEQQVVVNGMSAMQAKMEAGLSAGNKTLEELALAGGLVGSSLRDQVDRLSAEVGKVGVEASAASAWVESQRVEMDQLRAGCKAYRHRIEQLEAQLESSIDSHIARVMDLEADMENRSRDTEYHKKRAEDAEEALVRERKLVVSLQNMLGAISHQVSGLPSTPPVNRAPSPNPLVIGTQVILSLIHISEPTRLLSISYAVFCLKKKKKKIQKIMRQYTRKYIMRIYE